MQEETGVQDSLASFLESIGMKVYGNLAALTAEDRRMTIECVEDLLQHKQKDAQNRDNYMTLIQSLESEKRGLSRQVDYLNDRIDILTGDVSRAEAKGRTEASKLRQENLKLAADLAESKKECAKVSGSRDQLLHEVKKQEQAVAKLQEQLRKGNDSAYARNTIEMTSPLPLGPIQTVSANSELAAFTKRNYEEVVSNLSAELDSLRVGFTHLLAGLRTRMARVQDLAGLPEPIKAFALPAIRLNTENGAKTLAESTLELVDLLLGPEVRVEETEENEDEGVKTLKEARKKLRKCHAGVQTDIIQSQERMLDVVSRDQAQVKALETALCTPQFRQLLDSFPKLLY